MHNIEKLTGPHAGLGLT